ncbi:T6SS immunity protein Tli4 family protein [Achromobacter spanius]|uniref:T6SS immunity protein Tli4 family protein n=1 Tax=Achromobacter spanius TaxID=217203 RepID=A0AA42LT51_9BURK|nr:T6SS immunity protein Tli4 family protein [Achromobacter spanius]MDH0739100.1 T6SS immunity protein Tli4 family protein [Achromobacter spanius]
MKTRVVTAAIALAALVGGSILLLQHKDSPVTNATTDIRTWAFGRHLIDLPSNWRYSTGSDVTLYYGLDTDFKTVEVRVLGMEVSPERFADAVNDRSSQIKNVDHDSGGSMMVAQTKLSETKTLLRFFHSPELRNYHTHEIHLLVDDVYVLIKADSFENVIAPVEARIQALAKTISKITDPQSAGPGFGLGPIIIREHHDQEIGMLEFYISGSNINLEARITALQPDSSTGLQARAKKQLSGIWHNRLRAGKLTLAAMPAEQFAFGYTDANHHRFLFLAESYRDTPGFTQPSIHISMRGGGALPPTLAEDYQPDLVRWSLPRFVPDKHAIPPWKRPPAPPRVDAALSDREAGKIWDAILASIRLRYRAVAPKPPSVFDQVGNPEKAAADKKALDDFLSTDENGMPWTPPESGI